ALRNVAAWTSDCRIIPAAPARFCRNQMKHPAEAARLTTSKEESIGSRRHLIRLEINRLRVEGAAAPVCRLASREPRADRPRRFYYLAFCCAFAGADRTLPHGSGLSAGASERVFLSAR